MTEALQSQQQQQQQVVPAALTFEYPANTGQLNLAIDGRVPPVTPVTNAAGYAEQSSFVRGQGVPGTQQRSLTASDLLAATQTGPTDQHQSHPEATYSAASVPGFSTARPRQDRLQHQDAVAPDELSHVPFHPTPTFATQQLQPPAQLPKRQASTPGSFEEKLAIIRAQRLQLQQNRPPV